MILIVKRAHVRFFCNFKKAKITTIEREILVWELVVE